MIVMDQHRKITEILKSRGHQVHIVGGAVRDDAMGVASSDVDLVTSARPDEIELAFAEFPEFKIDLVGKSFGVVIISGIEVASYRLDEHAGIGDACCSVSLNATLEEDCNRRDFTFNAMAYSDEDGLIDFHGGLEDLKNGVVRFVGDPSNRIMEDPNRILRAARFLAKIEGRFHISTLLALQEHGHLVKTHVAPERIRKEIMKAMDLETPSLFFSALHLIGVLKDVFPELAESVDHHHGNHHVENVFEHSMLAGDHLSKRDPVLRLAGFLHDYGKPQSFKDNVGNPKVNFAGHEIVGRNLLRGVLENLRFHKDEIERILGLVRSHMYSLNDMSDKALRRMMRKFAERNVDHMDFLRLRLADRAGSVMREPFPMSDQKRFIKMFKTGGTGVQLEEKFGPKMLALSGGQIISIFGLKPGPQIGEIQKKLLDFIVEEGFEANTVERLEAEVKRLLETE